MKEAKTPDSRPVIVWERTGAGRGRIEPTVQEWHTAGDGEAGPNMPVIRIVSSGFGKTGAAVRGAASNASLRMAA